MSRSIKYQSEIPAAAYYVTMNDAFMSGWGGASSKIASYIYPCASLTEAETVAANARTRTDQRRIHIMRGVNNAGFTQRPKLLRGHTYQVVDKATARRWYTPGGFTKMAVGGKRRGGKARRAGGAGLITAAKALKAVWR